MRKGQLQEGLFNLSTCEEPKASRKQSANEPKAHRVDCTTRAVAPKCSKAAAGKAKTKLKPQFGALPLQHARVLNQLQALTLKPPAARQASGRENTAQPAASNTARQKPPATKQGSKPAHQRLQKLRRSVLAASGDTDSEVESPLSQHPHTRQQAPSPAAALQPACADTHQASTPSRSPYVSVCEASVADSPESMAMSTPVGGQAPMSCSNQLAAPMSCASAKHSHDRPAVSHHLLAARSNASSPMCISPDLWATPQQLQWELSEEADVSPDEQNVAVDADPVPAVSESQLQAAVLEFGFDAVQSASKVRQSRLAQLSQACSTSGQSSAPTDSSSFVPEPGYKADPEYLDDFELTQSQSQHSTRSDDASDPPQDPGHPSPQPWGVHPSHCDYKHESPGRLPQHIGEATSSPMHPYACPLASSISAG